jgi:glucan phosphoethanolaminetransferase (alkaline phosphatase superfamily)
VIAIGGFLIFFVSLTSVIISVRNLGKEEASLYDGYDIGEMSMIFIKLLDENPFTRPLSSAYMFNSLREFHNSLPKESWNDVYPREKNRFSSEATIHVVVIGESANKDHFSVYGYNQPTMEDVKGLVAYDGVIAPSVVTRLSVPRILSKNETSLSYLAGKNIISLANKAGFDTYWISNQAKYGIFDTQVSRIASESKYSFYANLDFLSSKPDSILIPAFKETISKKSPNQKVIFLNTMGSHSDFCRRFNAEDAIVKTNRPPQFDCYDNSIKASFDFLLGLRDILDDSGSNYSIIYFSDHGLRMIEHPPYYVHDTTDKVLRSSVEIPFFVLDSMNRDKPSVTIKKNYNMRDFYATFSDWLDITSSEINLDKSIFLGHDSYQMSYEIIDVNLQKQNVQ